MKIIKLTVGSVETNCYIAVCNETKEMVIIDPGGDCDLIIKTITNLKAKYIINTHGHYDHIKCNQVLKNFTNAPVLIHKNDAFMLTNSEHNFSFFLGEQFSSPPADKLLEDNDIISFGKIKLLVIHTPGHTKGGICLLYNKILFTGDTLFAGSIGRCDFPFASEKNLLQSINTKLMSLSDDIKIYPGHGENSTLGIEKKTNPFIKK